MKIGLLGGTFNPPHIGHLILAEEALDQLGLEKIIFIPSCIPPHKEVEHQTPARDRVNMVRLALKNKENFEISSYEIDKGGTSYAIDTIKYFKSAYKAGDEFFYITGSDSLAGLCKWKDIEEILSSVRFVAAARPGWEETADKYEDRISRITIPMVDISSSLIRERARRGEPIDHLVHSDVAKYIHDRGLYK